MAMLLWMWSVSNIVISIRYDLTKNNMDARKATNGSEVVGRRETGMIKQIL